MEEGGRSSTLPWEGLVQDLPALAHSSRPAAEASVRCRECRADVCGRAEGGWEPNTSHPEEERCLASTCTLAGGTRRYPACATHSALRPPLAPPLPGGLPLSNCPKCEDESTRSQAATHARGPQHQHAAPCSPGQPTTRSMCALRLIRGPSKAAEASACWYSHSASGQLGHTYIRLASCGRVLRAALPNNGVAFGQAQSGAPCRLHFIARPVMRCACGKVSIVRWF